MGEIVKYPGITKLDLPPERILSAALERELTEVVVVGFDKEGEYYFSSSVADGGSVIWLLEMAKKKLLEIGDG